MNCEQGHYQELAGKYVAGELSAEETAAFEEHYFECDACLAAVEFGQALKFGATAETAEAAEIKSPKVIEMPARTQLSRPARHWIYAAIAAAAVVAVTLVGWRALNNAQTPNVDSARSTPASAVASANPATPTPEPQLVAVNTLADAEAVEALAYRPAVLRGATEDSAERFRKTMEAYQARDYRKAALGLSSIPVGVPGSGKPDEHITDAGVHLYLGVSRLMLHENGDAIRALRRSIAYGDTPYIESAEFYLAKGLIRQKQYADAAKELQHAIALNGDRQRDAQQLLEQVNQLQAK